MALNRICLLQYNNYYNRRVRRRVSLGDYLIDDAVLVGDFSFVSFNPNDGLTTKQIINYTGEEIPDYLLVMTGNTINSRWYIIEAKRTRENQYELQLLRDVCADWYDEIIAAPAFIKRAMLPTSSSLIFNNENFSFSQVKTNEIKLHDKSRSPWYAVYLKRDVGDITLNIAEEDIPYDIAVSQIEDYEFWQYQENPLRANPYDIKVLTRVYSDSWTQIVPYETIAAPLTVCFNAEGLGRDVPNIPGTWSDAYYEQLPYGIGATGRTGSGTLNFPSGRQLSVVQFMNDYFAALQEEYKNTPNAFADWAITYAQYAGIMRVENLPRDGAIIKDISTGKYYKMNVSTNAIEDSYYTNVTSVGTTLYQRLNVVFTKLASQSVGYTTELVGSGPFSFQYNYSEYLCSFEEIPVVSKTITIPSTRQHNLSEAFDLIMMPAKTIYLDDGSYTTERATQEVINQLQYKVAAENLLDIQLVPYCPILDYYWGQRAVYGETFGELRISENVFINTKNYSYSLLGEEGTKECFFCYFPSTNNFQKTLRDVGIISGPIDPIEFKLWNEATLYRLCSPNYNGVFEFSAAKNDGITGYNVAASYRPHSPYIKVSPIFNRLYGKDYYDARGLICGGDFSISQISDAWNSYELNNKNYQVMFNRQIENMEINNKYGFIQDIASGAAGSLGGVVGGAMLGGAIGGPAGMAIGAVAGAATSAAAGAADIYISERLREEAIDYTTDNFGYSLGNIKALPYNITKITSRNVDNKVFPFLEVYEGTREEKQAFREKIKWNSMTVMEIATIQKYLQTEETFIQGQLLRLEGLGEEYHLANAIANEIKKGVFI